MQDEFTEKLAAKLGSMKIGRGTEEGVQVGPLIDGTQRDKVADLVQDALAKGAEAVVGGTRREGAGYFFDPTVLAGVDPEARLLDEEIFGPVAPVIGFDDEEAAIAAANDTEYGLVAYVFTRDLKRAFRVIEGLETGMVGLNQGMVSNAAAPFGGIKASRLRPRGRARGDAGVPGDQVRRDGDVTPDPLAQLREWYAAAQAEGVLRAGGGGARHRLAGRPPRPCGSCCCAASTPTAWPSTRTTRAARGASSRPTRARPSPSTGRRCSARCGSRGRSSGCPARRRTPTSTSRPRGSRLGAWASRQGSVIPDRESLEARVDELAARWPGETEIPRPPYWGGYRLRPDAIEFWEGRPNRLHDRIHYLREDGGWRAERLSP